MIRVQTKFTTNSHSSEGDNSLFARIADDIREKGYSINPSAMPAELIEPLYEHVVSMNAAKFTSAGIGRGEEYTHSKFVRTDEIAWIEGNSQAGRDWLDWTKTLQVYLNRRLLLGLFSFESHFSHYGIGDFYKRHKDAFRGEANRVLSVVLYLNPGWTVADGGELLLYPADDGAMDVSSKPAVHDAMECIKVTPLMGTLVLFLSEEFPHEVLPANRDRFAIAGWYRVNTSVSDRVDPPR